LIVAVDLGVVTVVFTANVALRELARIVTDAGTVTVA